MARRELTPEEQAKFDKIRARNRTSEARDQEERDRELVRREFPPAAPDEEMIGAMAFLRVERERRGLSLADIHERSGMDPGALSRLERGIGNPTMVTIRKYAAALGLEPRLSFVDAEAIGAAPADRVG